ncbi:hypothetical protein [Achromobacter spanius]
MKWTLTGTAILVMLGGLLLAWHGNNVAFGISLTGAALLLLCANLDRIAELSASWKGVTAKTREVLKDAETAVSELQMLATQLSAISLSLVRRNGRMGGYTRQESEAFRDSILEVLRRLKIPADRIAETLTEWHQFTEFDHVVSIANAASKYCAPTPEQQEIIRERLYVGLGHSPSPIDVRRILAEAKLTAPELDAAIEDYEHYVQHRQFRRPDVWDTRHDH